MSTDQDRMLRIGSMTRDLGDAPTRLRAAAAEVPFAASGTRFGLFDPALIRVFGRSMWVRPVVILIVLAAMSIAIVGAAILRPWDPFPPRGLIAYTVPL